LGFVALNPTYILPVLLRNAKPNNGRFRNRAPKVSISIKLAAFQASGAAFMKLHSGVSFSIKPAVFLAGGWAETYINHWRTCCPAGATFTGRSLGKSLDPSGG
jgi:hypothetical protein